MTIIEALLLGAWAYATLWCFYLLLFPIAANVWRKPVKRINRIPTARLPKIAVIIPGRNVARSIASCIRSLRACEYPSEMLDFYVIADHCDDNTVEKAQANGVSVLIRNDGPRGKTYTISWALTELTNRGVFPDLYLIIDATALVEASFVTAIAQRWKDGEDIISSHSILNPENKSWYARCLGLMLVHRNLQCWAREQFGFSALLEGRGMAFSRDYVKRFGWSLALPKTQGVHPTEDWRHAVRAVEQGCRIAFADNARLFTPLRTSLSEATQQGARWERGRLINAATYGIRLLMRGLWQRNAVKNFAGIDALQPPVAILAAISLGIGAFSFLVTRNNALFNAGSYMPFALIILYGMVVVLRGRQEGIALSTVIWGPIYVIWRCAAFILAWVFFDRMNTGRRENKMANPSATSLSFGSRRNSHLNKLQ